MGSAHWGVHWVCVCLEGSMNWSRLPFPCLVSHVGCGLCMWSCGWLTLFRGLQVAGWASPCCGIRKWVSPFFGSWIFQLRSRIKH